MKCACVCACVWGDLDFRWFSVHRFCVSFCFVFFLFSAMKISFLLHVVICVRLREKVNFLSHSKFVWFIQLSGYKFFVIAYYSYSCVYSLEYVCHEVKLPLDITSANSLICKQVDGKLFNSHLRIIIRYSIRHSVCHSATHTARKTHIYRIGSLHRTMQTWCDSFFSYQNKAKFAWWLFF